MEITLQFDKLWFQKKVLTWKTGIVKLLCTTKKGYLNIIGSGKEKGCNYLGFKWDCDCVLVENIFVRGILLNEENSKQIGKEDEKWTRKKSTILFMV